MEKSCNSTADSSSSTVTTAASSGKDNNPYHLKHLSLNKLSHKISKPTISTNLDQHHLLPGNLQQPPVYNINKSDFREVVQKLTGSPAHERLSSLPPIQAPKPPSSRLQRIRPPPLAQLSVRPPSLLNAAAAASSSLPQNQNPIPNNQIQIPAPASSISNMSTSSGVAGGFNPIGRPMAPLSPLPPLPSVHASADSPVSAYMRYLQSSTSGDSRTFLFSGFSPLAPPATPPPPPASAPANNAVSSPLPLQQPFGCLNSPRSPYALLSPGPLFSPSWCQLGFPQLPLSPTVAVLSPRYGGGI